MSGEDLLVNSRDGIRVLFAWAKAHGVVLNLTHEAIAKKWGVSTEGVNIMRPIPNIPRHPMKAARDRRTPSSDDTNGQPDANT